MPSQPRNDRDFGNNLRRLRQGRGLTQEALANRSNLSVDAVRRLEQGAFSPSLNTVRKLSQGLNISLKTMFETFQRRRRELVHELCDFLDDLTGAEVAQVWRVVRAMFKADSRHAK